jgi:glycosyltransferase involved in cell wall biosynthesis
MKIEAYIIVWNEVDTIQFTINHYKSFCDKITFYDNYSDDGTLEVIKANDCEVVHFGTVGKLEDKEYIKVKNNCWKNSNADWVIVCDSDEIVFHNDLINVLEREKTNGNTVFRTNGVDMFSKIMPVESFNEITMGIKSENYSKIACFSPNIRSINYVFGCHVADPVGNVRYCSEKLSLHHYRNIGGYQRLIKRHEVYRQRMSDHNKRLGLGIHYTYDNERRKKDWLNSYSEVVVVSTQGLV